VHTSAPASDGFKDYDRWHCRGVTAVTPGEWMKHIVEMAAAIGANASSSTNLAIRRCFGEPLASSFKNYQSLQAVSLLPNAYRDHARRETHGQLGAQAHWRLGFRTGAHAQDVRWWARQDSNLRPDRYERQTIEQVR
jgi:hypothetical protein